MQTGLKCGRRIFGISLLTHPRGGSPIISNKQKSELTNKNVYNYSSLFPQKHLTRVALEIERRLAEADIKQVILDKIEKLDKDLVDIAIGHLSTDIVVKEFLMKLSYHRIERDKRVAEIRLNDLQLLK